MSDDRPSIAELQKLVQRMESAPWDRTTPHAVSNAEYDLGRFDGPGDAAGTCALRNAAPVLLEIAETGLAWSEAEDALGAATGTNSRVRAAIIATEAFDKLRAALAKVRP